MNTFICRACLSVVTLALLTPAALARSGYTVHEWGTFTSVQGGDGELLPWRPLQTSELPGFVYNWRRAGLNRAPLGRMDYGKGAMVTLQRMETPVIYFYSDRDLSVDVGVAFPQGIITEWYPQATQLGPSKALDTNGTAAATLEDSRAVWKNLRLLAPKTNPSAADALPQDNSGSHYFAAREPASDFVQMSFAGPGGTVTETDKFIFYRGAGSFKTPLHVSVDSAGAITVNNNGAQGLKHLFLVSVHDNGRGKTAAFTALKEVAAGDSVLCPQSPAADFVPVERFQSEIFPQMQAALTEAGLFPDEAAAMVHTWKDSWFAEEGDRVLYVLPRSWTDATLPLTLQPVPHDLVRVMVGRAEILTPKTVEDLSGALNAAARDYTGGQARVVQKFRALGRFGQPALRLAFEQDHSTNALAVGYQLLSQAMRPEVPAKSQ